MSTRTRVAALIVATLWAGLASAVEPQLVDRVAAVVGDEVIAMSEVYDLGGPFIEDACAKSPDPVGRSDASGISECRRSAELQVLDTLILQVLVRQELVKLDLDVTEEELDRSIDQLARDYGIPDVESLRREVEKTGASWSEYRDTIREQLRQLKFQEAVIKPRVTVSDDDLRDLYARSKEHLSTGSEADIEAITIVLPKDPTSEAFATTVADAQKIADAINGGTLTWVDAVKKYHSGQFTGEGGRMPTIKKGDLMPALDKVVFSAAIGKVADPVIAGGVVFLVHVLDRREGGVKPFEEVRDQLLSAAYEQKISEQSEAWYASQRKTAAIRILLEPPPVAAATP